MSLSPEQLAVRSRGIGASEVSAAVGLSPYTTPFQLWAKKRGLVEDDAEESRFADWGNRLESPIVKWACEKLGIRYVPHGSGTRFHPDVSFIFATPDHIAHHDSAAALSPFLIQAKNAGLRMAHHFGDEADDIPDHMAAQVQQELEVCNLEIGYLAVLIGGNDPRLYEVRRDRALWASLLTIARAFWERHVVTGEPPPVDGSERTRRWLHDRHPRAIEREVRAATDEEREHAETYVRLRDELKALEKAKDERGNALRQSIGDAETIEGPWGKVTWKNDSAGKPEWKAIAEELLRMLPVADACVGLLPMKGASPSLAYYVARGLVEEEGKTRLRTPAEIIAAHTPPGGRVLRVTVKK